MDTKTYLTELSKQAFFRDEKTPGSLRAHIAWYRRRAPARRILFRTTGLTALVISISLPFYLSTLSNSDKATAAMCGAWLIALLSGLNGFFNWDRVWRSYIEAQLQLQSLLTLWDVQSTSLALLGGPQALVDLDKLARHVVTEAMKTIVQETGGYFARVDFPALETPKAA